MMLTMVKQIAVIIIATTAANTAKAAPRIAYQIDDSAWSTKSSAIYPRKGQQVRLRVEAAADAAVRWYRITAHLPKMYKNANHPWEENPYQWVGFGKIEYQRVELEQFRNQRTIALPLGESALLGDSTYDHADVGTFWFQVEVEHAGKIKSSPGLEANDERGISPGVFRVSVREEDGYLGYLTSFYNVPGLFGSIPYQSGNYIGVDCADVLMAALERWRGKLILKDFNVAGLARSLPKIMELEVVSGQPSEAVAWTKQVQPGDFIAVRFTGKKQYQHIGALYRDANGNGVLDGADLVLHAGPYPLHASRLDEGGFDGHVLILRPKR